MSTKKTDVDDTVQIPVVDIPQPLSGSAAPATVIYADTLYTSRSLFLSDDRQLNVLRGQVEVLADDAEAIAYLAGNAEFQPLVE